MAEPSTVTGSMATTLISGAAMAQILPFVDANAVIGAVIGAALVASTKKDLTAWRRFVSFLLSALCGFGGAGEIVARELAKETFLPALIGALVIVPLALKLLAMVPDIDLGGLLRLPELVIAALICTAAWRVRGNLATLLRSCPDA